jgi:hypothetical protein
MKFILTINKRTKMGQAKRRGTLQERIAQAKQMISDSYDQFAKKYKGKILDKNKFGIFLIHKNAKQDIVTFRATVDSDQLEKAKTELKSLGIDTDNKQELAGSINALLKYHKYFNLDMTKLPDNVAGPIGAASMGLALYCLQFNTGKLAYNLFKERGNGLGMTMSSVDQDDMVGQSHYKNVLHEVSPYDQWDDYTKDIQAEWSQQSNKGVELISSYFERNSVCELIKEPNA